MAGDRAAAGGGLAQLRPGGRRPWRRCCRASPVRPLVTRSTGDRLNLLAFNQPGIARLRQAELVTFPGGHAPFLECPAAFDAAFARFAAALP
ncbi:MAG: hypothetical protein U0802_16305 [Candidatus Binatia bacterium]